MNPAAPVAGAGGWRRAAASGEAEARLDPARGDDGTRSVNRETVTELLTDPTVVLNRERLEILSVKQR
jgi:hypothetical protein